MPKAIRQPEAKESGEKFLPGIALLVIGIHFLALGGIWFFSLQAFLLFCAAHLFLSIFGISLGHHRLFAHRSFSANPILKKFFAVCANLCFQGGVIYWSSLHRAHHIRSERIGDPHSATRGFFWAHVLWLFYKRPNGFSLSQNKILVKDLTSDPFLVWLDRWSIPLNIAVLGVLFLWAGCFAGRWDLFFWLGPVRIVSIWNVAWITNSYLHGARLKRGATTGLKNNILGDLLVGGEGWHRDHHRRPGLVTHKAFFHMDTGYYVLKILDGIGMVQIRKRAKTSSGDKPLSLENSRTLST